ncbi:MAG TPA: hypothetical protein PKU85_03405 [Bacteroidales bacterium]|nr:MAG: hypothetical protein BWX62_00337 [Bacteroidetes bacterium ADurb.Bin037]HPV88245.1 hypothetical protein [Bacteroidales bacterium]HPW78564.1 hypothetical protein [Bacteroidales bacterium]HQB55775.1 hypothetical protein [Bacteroidales bacterium]
MALKISFFNTPKHRVFNYKPRFWNPEKEEFEERVRRAREKAGLEKGDENRPYVPGSSIRGSFQKRHEVVRRLPKRQKLIRFVFIITIAIILIMALYFSKFIGYLYSII